jgi:hypothetical protein
MKQTMKCWMPAAFCLILAVFATISSTSPEQVGLLSVLVAFFSLLGGVLSGTRRELLELRRRLSELEGKRTV